MAESSPSSPPPRFQPDSPDELKHLNTQKNPNPNPTAECEDVSQDPQPQTQETQNPAVDPGNPKSYIVVENHERDNLELEQEHGLEGIGLALSPLPHPSISDAKGLGKKRQVAVKKKLQTLTQNFNPIPFVPGKSLDVLQFEELLKRLGLWDFAHIELDTSFRTDLITELIVNYSPENRVSFVNDCKIGVNRADLGKALKLPGKKAEGDYDVEEFPVEFLSFLDEFVSNWMLLHEELWITPSEVLNWTNLIKSGHPEKVDWAGLVWFMVEKELALGENLKDCYYASHLQQLIKMQKEDLLREHPKVEAMSEEDEDGDDVLILDYEETSSGVQRLDEQSAELRHAQDSITPMEIVADAEKVENVDGIEEEENDYVDKIENMGDDAPSVGSASEECKVENLGEVKDTGSSDEICEVDIVEIGECIINIDNVDESKEKNVGNADVHENNIPNGDDHFEISDDTKNAQEDGKDGEKMDFRYCNGEEQGLWLLDGKNDGGHPFLHRCSATNTKTSMEDEEHVGVHEGMKHEDVKEDGPVEGFRIMQKGRPLEGIFQANFMQAFEAQEPDYPSTDLDGQPFLQLMSSRVENDMMLGGPSVFNHSGKREIEHDHNDHSIADNHKKMRVDGLWGHKSSEFDTVLEQLMHLTGRAKMLHDFKKQEAYEQGSVDQQFIAHEIARKDNEIMQLRCKVDELERRRREEVHRLDRELYLTSSVINGYRRALKDSQRAFAEYRKQFAVPDEPVYKDAGNGGVVKSIMELEKERLEQEERKKIMCCFLEETYTKYMNDYEFEWEELVSKVESLDSRLLMAAGEVELLKENLVKCKMSCEEP